MTAVHWISSTCNRFERLCGPNRDQGQVLQLCPGSAMWEGHNHAYRTSVLRLFIGPMINRSHQKRGHAGLIFVGRQSILNHRRSERLSPVDNVNDTSRLEQPVGMFVGVVLDKQSVVQGTLN